MIAAAVVLSKSFNNGFDFERGLWWRKMGAAAYAPKTSVFENPQGPQFRIWVTSNIMSSYYRTNYISTQVARLVFPNLASA